MPTSRWLMRMYLTYSYSLFELWVSAMWISPHAHQYRVRRDTPLPGCGQRTRGPFIRHFEALLIYGNVWNLVQFINLWKMTKAHIEFRIRRGSTVWKRPPMHLMVKMKVVLCTLNLLWVLAIDNMVSCDSAKFEVAILVHMYNFCTVQRPRGILRRFPCSEFHKTTHVLVHTL